MRLLDAQRFSGIMLICSSELFIQVAVKFARRVIRDVENLVRDVGMEILDGDEANRDGYSRDRGQIGPCGLVRFGGSAHKTPKRRRGRSDPTIHKLYRVKQKSRQAGWMVHSNQRSAVSPQNQDTGL
jgi:hypothetical protein